MSATTTGVKMTFKNANGKTFSKTLNGMNAETIKDTVAAESFVDDYKGIVDGTVTAAQFITTAPVDID